MKTGKFIEQQYEREIARIVSETEMAESQILDEAEILALQERLHLHEFVEEGCMIVNFNCGGGVGLHYRDGGGNWRNLFYTYQNYSPDFETLKSLRLCALKTIHPKRAGELVRMLAKRHMLDLSVEPAPIKAWWKFW